MKNNLQYTTLKTIGDETIYVKIRLNDECKNGHQDFAITGDIYKAGKPKVDRYFISGGCIHEDILKHFQEFKIFVNLHLCDYEGIPMYAVENGYYYLRNGFNNTKTNDTEFKNKFCEYYRITEDQFNVLRKCKNEGHYAIKIVELNILNQWKTEAEKAIKILEDLTGENFKIDSVKNNFENYKYLLEDNEK